jgi:HlyD family secretion protein
LGAKLSFPPSSKWVLGGAIAISLGLLAAGILQVNQSQTAQKQAEEAAKAKIEPARPAVTALGRIEPEGEVIDISGPSGERIGQLLVQEGQQVKKGQPLVYLESYQERQADRDFAADQLREAQALLKSETAYGQAQIQEARSRREQITDPKTAEILAQRATISRIKAELASAQRDLQRFESLQREGVVSQQTLDNQALAVASKREELNNAQATLAKLSEEKTTNIDNASAQLRSAEANLARSQTQVKVASAVSNLKLAEAKLERTIIRAPQAGQILKIFARAGEAIGETDGILQMGDTRQMYVVAEVYETDVGLVKVGQPATVTSPAFAGKIEGTVERIGRKVAKNAVIESDPAANTDVRVVEVRIRLQNAQSVAGLTNLQVDVAIAIPSADQRPAPQSSPQP